MWHGLRSKGKAAIGLEAASPARQSKKICATVVFHPASALRTRDWQKHAFQVWIFLGVLQAKVHGFDHSLFDRGDVENGLLAAESTVFPKLVQRHRSVIINVVHAQVPSFRPALDPAWPASRILTP
jgi:hypothetical protein